MFRSTILRKKIVQFLLGGIGNVLIPDRRQLGSKAITIFAYHNIVNQQSELDKCDDLYFINLPFEKFKKQILWIKDNYDIIDMKDVVDGKKLPEKPALITFDDGFKSVYDLAFPLLRQQGVVATIFLTGDHVANKMAPWISRLHYAIDNTKMEQIEFNGSSYKLTSDNGVKSFLFMAKKRLRKLSKLEMQNELRQIEDRLEVEVSDGFLVSNFLTDREISDLCRAGWTVGNHSYSHRLMGALDSDDQAYEICSAQAALSRFEGYKDIFAIPFGGKDSFTEASIDIAKKCGIKFMLSTIPDENVDVENRYVLGRIICETFSFSYFKFLTTGRKKWVADVLCGTKRSRV